MALKGVFLEDGTEIKTSDNASITSTTAWASIGAVSSRADLRGYVKYTANVKKSTVVISADSFPGTYYITGDTYARSHTTGKDQFFQFIIPKAKVSSEQSITLEAEGDPSTFNMNLTVLRPDSGSMMELVQYDLTNEVPTT